MATKKANNAAADKLAFKEMAKKAEADADIAKADAENELKKAQEALAAAGKPTGDAKVDQALADKAKVAQEQA